MVFDILILFCNEKKGKGKVKENGNGKTHTHTHGGVLHKYEMLTLECRIFPFLNISMLL